MARVINVKRALELKRHTEGDCYTLCVKDADIPENDGVFQVRCENGMVSVQKTPQLIQADLTVDVRELAQLLLGTLSLEQILYKPDVQLHGNLQTLQRVYPRRQVFLTDHF